MLGVACLLRSQHQPRRQVRPCLLPGQIRGHRGRLRATALPSSNRSSSAAAGSWSHSCTSFANSDPRLLEAGRSDPDGLPSRVEHLHRLRLGLSAAAAGCAVQAGDGDIVHWRIDGKCPGKCVPTIQSAHRQPTGMAMPGSTASATAWRTQTPPTSILPNLLMASAAKMAATSKIQSRTGPS